MLNDLNSDLAIVERLKALSESAFELSLTIREYVRSIDKINEQD